MTDEQKRTFYREVAEVFFTSRHIFKDAFEELIKVLEKYGFEYKKRSTD